MNKNHDKKNQNQPFVQQYCQYCIYLHYDNTNKNAAELLTSASGMDK